MFMNESELLLLNYLLNNNEKKTQRDISNDLNLSLGNINLSLKKLQDKHLVDETYKINNQEIKPYQVKSAIILAAGVSLRMLPLNTSLPKPLLSINDEILIERIIKQLHETNIKNIYIIVGYEKEKFEYLIDQYDVHLIVNPDFASDNNSYSLFLARNHLSNSYIIPGDLYFKTNPFKSLEDESYYLFSTSSTNNDFFSITSKRQIVKRNINDNRKHYKAIGLAYIAKRDSTTCQSLLEKLIQGHFNTYWEEILLLDDGLKLKPTYLDDTLYKEINTFEDLRSIDSHSKSLDNEYIQIIQNVFHVSLNDIKNVSLMKKGMTNRSLLFSIHDESYIMRIPGEGTSKLINRQHEYDSYQVIKDYQISDDVIYINPETGVKITRFIPGVHNCLATNKEEVKACIHFLKQFHSLKLKVNHTFDVYQQIDYYEKLRGNLSLYSDYEKVKEDVFSLKRFIDSVPKEYSLCHIDSVPDNFLLDEKGRIYLIDWEYSSMNDPHLDIAMFAIYAMYDKKMVDYIIDIYFEKKCDTLIRYKIYSYIAISGLLWSNWCEYKHTLGVEFGQYSLEQYRYAKVYSKMVLQYLKEDSQHESR